jgi:DNA-binding CsgD family transcriptional regulator/tetratricopeptide (TPR) repeat protein
MPPTFTSVRFVGREREFARLAAALDATAEGRATTLLLESRAGHGASRFLSEVERRLADAPEPFLVLRGRSYGAADGPYTPILGSLGAILESLPDAELATLVGPAVEDHLKLLPWLRPRLERLGALPEHATTTDPERRQPRVLEGILGLLGRLSERSPVLLVLEDLHLADAATLALATFLGRITRDQRLCLVASYQPAELTPAHPLNASLAALAELPRPPQRIDLPALGRDDLAELLESIEGERPSASLLLLVAERSRGSALVAEEILAARRDPSGAPLTAPFEELVVARAGRRSPECRRVIRLLAPAAAPLTVAQLVDAATTFEVGAVSRPPRSSAAPRRGEGPLDPDLAAGLEEAVEHGLLARSGDSVGFRHDLLGRAIAADLLPHQRRRHHAALAAALGGSPAAAASHWLAAHEPAAARSASIAAADLAESLDAPQDALRALELALELSEPSARRGTRGARIGGDAEEVTLQLRAAEAAFGAGRAARATAYGEAAIGKLDARRDRVRLGLIHERLGHYRRAVGDHEGAVAAHRRAVELVPREATAERARVLAGLAQIRMLEGTFSEAERYGTEALRVARAAAAPEIEAHALTTLGVVEGWGHDPSRGIALLDEARALADRLGRLDEVFRVYANLTTILDLIGQREEAVRIAYEGIAEARRVGQEAVYGNFLRGNCADSLFLLGRWAESRSVAATALEWSPAGVNFANSVMNLATVEIESSAGEVAGRLLGRLLLELETVPDAQYSGPAYQAAASFALWRGDLPDALRAADRAWARVRETEDWPLAARLAVTVLEVDAARAADARVRRDLAELADAREHSAAVLGRAEAMVRAARVPSDVGSRREADAQLATARALRARIEGRDDPRTWDKVARLWESLGDPYARARALWRGAEAILAASEGRTERAKARAPLLEAARIGAALGAAPLLREIRELAGRAMITLPDDVVIAPEIEVGEAVAVAVAVPGGNGQGPEAASPLVRAVAGEATPRRTDTFGLSPREKEVLGLIATGRTNREIGERLFISQKTVGVHVGNILAKLGVSGRVEAATVAIRLGLTEARR